MASEVKTIVDAAPLLDDNCKLPPLAKASLCMRVADANLSLCLKRVPVTLHVDGVPGGLRKDAQIHDWRVYATLTSEADPLENRIQTVDELLKIENRREARSFLYKQLAYLYRKLAVVPAQSDDTCPLMNLPEELCLKIASCLKDPKDRANFGACNTVARRLERLSRTCIRIDGLADSRRLKSMLKASPNAEVLVSKTPLRSSFLPTLIRQSSDKLVDLGGCPIEVSSWKHVRLLFQRATSVSLVVDSSCLTEAQLLKYVKSDLFASVTSLQLGQVGPGDEGGTSPEAFAKLLSCLPNLANLYLTDMGLVGGHIQALSECLGLRSLTFVHCNMQPGTEPSRNLKDLPLRDLVVCDSRDCSLTLATVQELIRASRKTLQRFDYDHCQYQTLRCTMVAHALVDLELNRWSDLWYLRFDESLPKLRRLAIRSDCQLSMELPYTFDELETLVLGSKATVRVFDLCGCVAYISLYRVTKFPKLKLIETHLDIHSTSSHALSQIARQLGEDIELKIV